MPIHRKATLRSPRGVLKAFLSQSVAVDLISRTEATLSPTTLNLNDGKTYRFDQAWEVQKGLTMTYCEGLEGVELLLFPGDMIIWERPRREVLRESTRPRAEGA